MAGVKDSPLLAKGYQQLVAPDTATALTVPAGANRALIQCTAQNVRWRDDGTNPTTTVGMLLLATSDGLWFTGDVVAMRVISAVAGAVVNVSYYA